MTAMPINWHEECLNNQKDYLARQKEQLNRLAESVEKLSQQTILYEEQINRAKSEKRKKFDRERFNQKVSM